MIFLARNYPALKATAARVNPLVPATIAIFLSVYSILPFTLPFIVELLIELGFIIATTFFLFQVSLDISRYSGRVTRLIGSIGYCSFGMYLIHPFILYLVITGLFAAGLNRILGIQPDSPRNCAVRLVYHRVCNGEIPVHGISHRGETPGS